jgi:hypothetical protein
MFNAIYLLALALSFGFTQTSDKQDYRAHSEKHNFSELSGKFISQYAQSEPSSFSSAPKTQSQINPFLLDGALCTHFLEQSIQSYNLQYVQRTSELKLSPNKFKLLYPFHFFW